MEILWFLIASFYVHSFAFIGDDPDAFRPAELNYHAPEWIREVPGRYNHYQMSLKRKEHLAKTCYPENHPYSWLRLNKRVEKQYRKLRKMIDQHRWTNYRGIQSGDVSKQHFRTKYPFWYHKTTNLSKYRDGMIVDVTSEMYSILW